MTTGTPRIDVAPAQRAGAAWFALALSLLSLPGSLFPWDWFAWGGVVIGVPLALAGLVLGLRARSAADATPAGRRLGTAAAVIAVAVLLIPLVWTVASVLG